MGQLIYEAICLIIIGCSLTVDGVQSDLISTLTGIKSLPEVQSDQCDSSRQLSICKNKIIELLGETEEAKVLNKLKLLLSITKNNQNSLSIVCRVNKMFLQCYQDEIEQCKVSREVVNQNQLNEAGIFSILMKLKVLCEQKNDNGEVDPQKTFLKRLTEMKEKMMELMNDEKLETAKEKVKAKLLTINEANIPKVNVEASSCKMESAREILSPCMKFGEEFLRGNGDGEDMEVMKFALSHVLRDEITDSNSQLTKDHLDKVCSMLSESRQCINNAGEICKENEMLKVLLQFNTENDADMEFSTVFCKENTFAMDLNQFRESISSMNEILQKMTLPDIPPKPDHTDCATKEASEVVAPCLDFRKNHLQMKSDQDRQLTEKAVLAVFMSSMEKKQCGQDSLSMNNVCKLTHFYMNCMNNAKTNCRGNKAVIQLVEDTNKNDFLLKKVEKHCMKKRPGAKEAMQFLRNMKLPNESDQPAIEKSKCNEKGETVFEPCKNFLHGVVNTAEDKLMEEKLMAISDQIAQMAFEDDSSNSQETIATACKFFKMSRKCYTDGIAACSQVPLTKAVGEKSLKSNKPLNRILQFCKMDGEGTINLDQLRETFKKMKEESDHISVPKEVAITEDSMCSAVGEKMFGKCTNLLQRALKGDGEANIKMRAMSITYLVSSQMKDMKCAAKWKTLSEKICQVVKKADLCYERVMEKCQQLLKERETDRKPMPNGVVELLRESCPAASMEKPLEVEDNKKKDDEDDDKSNNGSKDKNNFQNFWEEKKKLANELEKKFKEDLKKIQEKLAESRKNPNADLSAVRKELIVLSLKKFAGAKKLREEEIAKKKQLEESINSDLKSVVQNLILPDVSPSVTDDNCQQSTVTEVFSSCQNYFVTIFGGKSDNYEMRMNGLAEIVTEKLNEKDADFLNTKLSKLCKMIYVGKTCYTDAQTTCISKKSVVNHSKTVVSKFKLWKVGESFCDEERVMSSQLEMVKSSNKKECSTKGVGAKVISTMTSLTEKLVSIQAYVTQDMVDEFIENGQLTNKEDQMKVKKVCLNVKSMTCEIQILLRKKKDNDCNEAAKIMIVETFRMKRLSGIGKVCAIPDPIKDGIAKKGKANDVKRESLVMMGLGHIMSTLTAGTKTFETCAQLSEGSIVLISHDTLRISAEVDSTKFNSPYMKSVTVTIIDSTDDSEVSVIFGNNLDNLPDKVDDITSKHTKMSYSLVKPLMGRFEDLNTGTYLVVKKILVNGTIPVYYVVFRGSLSVIKECNGVLITGCMDNQEIGTTTQSRRRKREASDASSCGQYDADISKDEKMKEGAKDTNDVVTESSKFDSQFTASSTNQILESGKEYFWDSGQDTVRVSAALLILASLLILVLT